MHSGREVLRSGDRERRSVTTVFFFFQAEDGIRDLTVTGVQTCALPISAEEPAPSLRSPDQARADHRAGLDLLIRPDLHLSPNARVIADDGVVADHAS